MKLQFGILAAVLVAVVFMVPGVREPVFEALPDLGDDDKDCREIVCSGKRTQNSKDAPDMNFRPR